MIGPHVGKELDLMLAGEKVFAAFSDVVPESGEIIEEIIPEQAFAPYVAEGKFIRIAKDFVDPGDGMVVRYVCFTVPGEEWRAQTYLWIREQIRSGKMPYDNACDVIIGRLLGYSEEDIQEFINQF